MVSTIRLPVLPALAPTQKGQSKREKKQEGHLETSQGHPASYPASMRGISLNA